MSIEFPVDRPVGYDVVVTDVFDASLINILNLRIVSLGSARRSWSHSSTRKFSNLFHASVPSQFKFPFPVPSDH